MKKVLFILLACMPLFLSAKDKKDNSNPKYLAGAVTLTDGKVTFNYELKAPALSQKEIYTQMLNWANERFKPEGDLQSRVVYSNEEKGEIAATAEEYIVFSSSALSLDRTRIYYQLFIYPKQGACNMEMTRIRYWYDENRDGGERYTAEEWITDDTIDLKDELFKSAAEALGVHALNAPQTVPAATLQPATPAVVPSTGGELKNITFEQLPENLSEIAASGRITLTANDEEIDLKADNWGGFGKLFNKNVAYLLVDQNRIAINAVMEHSDTYQISFYTEGSTQPGVVIECKKSMAQKMSADELKSLNQSIDTTKSYTMYMGEITNVQMR